MTRRVALLLVLLASTACSVDAGGLGPATTDDVGVGDDALDGTAGDDTLDASSDADSADAADVDVTLPDGSDETTTEAGDAADAPDASPDAPGDVGTPDAPDAPDAADDAPSTDAADADTCTDGVQDGDESDIDCGGHCAKCANGNRCHSGVDCGSTACSVYGLCVAVSCSNGVLDSTEADVDCGATCGVGCATGKHCNTAADCAGRLCTANVCALATTCDEILAGDPSAPTGTYPLVSTRTGATWSTYCVMTGSGATAAGWTLVAKASKSTATFAYDAALWSDANLLAGTADFAAGDAKLEGFLSIPVRAIRISLAPVASSPTRWLTLPLPTSGLPGGLTYPAASLAQVFGSGAYIPTSLGRDAWLGALPGASLQKNCNREGINVVAGAMSVRLGILSNEQGNCDSPDSRLGIGGAGSSCGTDAATRHGDVCACTCYDASGGSPTSADVPAQAYVFVR